MIVASTHGNDDDNDDNNDNGDDVDDGDGTGDDGDVDESDDGDGDYETTNNRPPSNGSAPRRADASRGERGL